MSQDIKVKTKVGEYLVKAGLLYTETDEWIREENGLVTVGITDYAQKKLRYIVSVELSEPGTEVKAGESIAVLESVKTIADVYSPVDGKLAEVNEDLQDNPDLINKDPYGKGWIAKIEVTGPLPKEKLLSPEEYAKRIRSKEE